MDWIKLEVATPNKPEVFLLAELLQLDADTALGKLVRLWTWLDQNAASPFVKVSAAHLDRLVGQRGFVKALVKIGWMQIGRDELAGYLVIVNFEKHLSNSAKKRAGGMNRTRDYRTRLKAATEAEAEEPENAETFAENQPKKSTIQGRKSPENQPATGENGDVSRVTEASPEENREEERRENSPLASPGGGEPEALRASHPPDGKVASGEPFSSLTSPCPQAPVTLAEAEAYGQSHAIPAAAVQLWWHNRQAIGWKLHGRVSIKCWESDLTGYHLIFQRNHPTPSSASAANVPPPPTLADGTAIAIRSYVMRKNLTPPRDLIALAWQALGGDASRVPPWLLLRERETELRRACPELEAWFAEEAEGRSQKSEGRENSQTMAQAL